MPFALKGIDVVIFSVFRKLGHAISVLPVMEDFEYDEEEYDSDDLELMNEDNPDYDSDTARRIYERDSQRDAPQMVGTAFHPVKFGGDQYEMTHKEKQKVRLP